MTIVTAKWSLQDYHQMIETGLLDERKVELVNGEIIEMSPEGAPHSSYCGEIAEYLRRILGDRAKVREDHPITLANNSELVIFRDLTTSGYQSVTNFMTGIIAPLAFPDLSIDIQQLLT
jgi:Uma2 family endonuclease